MSADFPPIALLLPQAGAARLLERVLAHDGDGTRCANRVSASARGRPTLVSSSTSPSSEEMGGVISSLTAWKARKMP